MFLECISRILHYKNSFVMQRITWKNVFGIIILENLISVLIKECYRNYFFVIISIEV